MTASTGPDVKIEKHYSPIELAALLGVNRRTIINWLRDENHPLDGVKLGNNTWRVPESNLKTYLEIKHGQSN